MVTSFSYPITETHGGSMSSRHGQLFGAKVHVGEMGVGEQVPIHEDTQIHVLTIHTYIDTS